MFISVLFELFNGLSLSFARYFAANCFVMLDVEFFTDLFNHLNLKFANFTIEKDKCPRSQELKPKLKELSNSF